MKRIGRGIGVLLFAILLQLSSTGMELLTLGLGILGLYMVCTDGKYGDEMI